MKNTGTEMCRFFQSNTVIRIGMHDRNIMIKMNKTKSLKIDLLRAVSCIAVLFYHLGVLKGGYLSVCAFFVLSGYFSVTSALKQEKFSILKYYKNRIQRICIPLWITVFVTITVMSLFPENLWLNLKPETTSVLLGYNNVWQLKANLDYFTRHVSSPFMHFWYLGILMQFELIFPFVFLLLKALKKYTGKLIPCLFCADIALISFAYFLITAKNGNIMAAYYGTFARLFSLTAGMALALSHRCYKPLVYRNSTITEIVFWLYMVCFGFLQFTVEASSSYFPWAMLGITLITMRMISCGISLKERKTVLNPIITWISSCSYEIYLVQYPVIYLLQMKEMADMNRILLTIVLTLLCAYLLHISLHVRKKDSLRMVKYACAGCLACVSLFGSYRYLQAEDHTEEMKQLEEDLNANRKLIEERQKQYCESVKNEEDAWAAVLQDMDRDEEGLKEIVTNLRVTGIGDSIMELAVRDLNKVFPNGYFDGVVNRTEAAGVTAIKELKNQGLLADIVVLCLGTNGKTNVKVEDQLMEAIGDRKVFWLNATHPDYNNFNPALEAMTERYDNLIIIDWVSVINEHPKYVISDKVHPTVTGCKVYAQTIYDAIYQEYLKEFREKKEEIIKEHEEKEKQKITFIGNDLLAGLYEDLIGIYPDGEYLMDPEYTYASLKETIRKKTDDNTLAYNTVFLMDASAEITEEEWNDLVSMCAERKVYICVVDRQIQSDNTHLISFEKNHESMSPDGIHLSDKGNQSLLESIQKEINTSIPKN
ncbi:MAG TPA: hypothetical protein DHW39_11880 [Erysipelotrichaceae bacterium]|nr:hypothetical protein [Erysipelotrichaceae bacterium]